MSQDDVSQKIWEEDVNIILQAAARVLKCEIEGLEALRTALDDSFVHAVQIIASAKGRLIVSGMGKSGHIARKIAATMASTGTPAHFVHPAEASHGDLGMVTPDDVVLLLSNSGETPELKDILYYCKRFSIPVVAMVRREKSALVEAADIAFILPEIPEASPVNAPTTSTTMMLAWGDALAVALLEKRGFKAEDFSIYHPGGKLGTQFITVAQLMRRGEALPVVLPNTPMTDVLITVTEKSLGCAIVRALNGSPAGIITDGDLRRHMGQNILQLEAAEVMTVDPRTVSPGMLAVEALALMNTHQITGLIVADAEGMLVGLLHIHDVLRAGIA